MLHHDMAEVIVVGHIAASKRADAVDVAGERHPVEGAGIDLFNGILVMAGNVNRSMCRMSLRLFNGLCLSHQRTSPRRHPPNCPLICRPWRVCMYWIIAH